MINETLLAAWPNCHTPDCENKASARRQSLFCDPCTTRQRSEGSAPADYFDNMLDEVARLKEERK